MTLAALLATTTTILPAPAARAAGSWRSRHHGTFATAGAGRAWRHGRHGTARSRHVWGGGWHGSYGGAVAATAGPGGAQIGRASFYAGGGRTANGGSVGSATCAHRSLPFGTRVLVTNLANARQAVLTVNDRGPFVHGRLLDVSRGAAGLLGMLHAGVSQIRMEVLGGAG